MSGTSKVETARPARRGDERDRVLAATLQILLADGPGHLQLDRVSTLSGVPKHAIYRQWPSLVHLVVEAMERALGSPSFTRGHDPAADLVRLFRMIHKRLLGHESGQRLLVLMQAILEDPQLSPTFRARVIDPLRDLAIDLATEAGTRGALRVAVAPAQLVDMLLGLVLYRALVLDAALSANALAETVEAMVVVPSGIVPTAVAAG